MVLIVITITRLPVAQSAQLRSVPHYLTAQWETVLQNTSTERSLILYQTTSEAL